MSQRLGHLNALCDGLIFNLSPSTIFKNTRLMQYAVRQYLFVNQATFTIK